MIARTVYSKNFKGIFLVILCSSFATLGYGLLLITWLNFGFDNNLQLIIYYSILAIPGAIYLIVNYFLYRKQVSISRVALGLLLLACATTVICSVGTQTYLVSRFVYATYGMSNHEVMEYQSPDFAAFIDEMASQIPDNENIVLFNGSFFTNYYLYPRKIYKHPYASSPKDIPRQWLEEKNIKWAMSYNSTHFSLEDARFYRLV